MAAGAEEATAAGAAVAGAGAAEWVIPPHFENCAQAAVFRTCPLHHTAVARCVRPRTPPVAAPPSSRVSHVPLLFGCLVYCQCVEIGRRKARANLEPIANLNTPRVKRALAGRYVCTCVYMYMYTRVCVRARACMRACMRACACVRVRLLVRLCVRVRACVRVCVWSLACSRAPPPPPSLSRPFPRSHARAVPLSRVLCLLIYAGECTVSPETKNIIMLTILVIIFYYVYGSDNRMNGIPRNKQGYDVNNFSNYFPLCKS